MACPCPSGREIDRSPVLDRRPIEVARGEVRLADPELRGSGERVRRELLDQLLEVEHGLPLLALVPALRGAVEERAGRERPSRGRSRRRVGPGLTGRRCSRSRAPDLAPWPRPWVARPWPCARHRPASARAGERGLRRAAPRPRRRRRSGAVGDPGEPALDTGETELDPAQCLTQLGGLPAPRGRCDGPGPRPPRPDAARRFARRPPSPSEPRRTPSASPARHGPRARCRCAGPLPPACAGRQGRRAGGPRPGGARPSDPPALAPPPSASFRRRRRRSRRARPVTRITATETADPRNRHGGSCMDRRRIEPDLTRTFAP